MGKKGSGHNERCGRPRREEFQNLKRVEANCKWKVGGWIAQFAAGTGRRSSFDFSGTAAAPGRI